MMYPLSRLNPAVTAAAALVALFALVSPLCAQERSPAPDLEGLMRELARPDQSAWMRIERQIRREWSRGGSDAVDYLFQRGEAALTAGASQVAIGHFSAVIDHAPDFTEAYNARAQAYFLAGELGPAIDDLRVVLAANPRHFDALTGLGTILEQLERDSEALEAYRTALALHPNRPQLAEAVSRLEIALAGRDT